MTKEEIIAGNETIAKFMGATEIVRYSPILMFEFPNGDLHHAEDLRYHMDWQWLMPVVKKVIDSEITNRYEFDLRESVRESLESCDIKIVWEKTEAFGRHIHNKDINPL